MSLYGWCCEALKFWAGCDADGVNAFVKFGQQEGDAPLSLGITWAVEDDLQIERECLPLLVATSHVRCYMGRHECYLV